MRTGQAAADYARSRVGTLMPAAGYCLQFTRENYPLAAYYASAIDAWNGAAWPHPDDRNPPVGTPVYFWTSSPYRHVAIMLDGGQIASTFNDEIRLYQSIGDVERYLGGPFMGWAEDLNGVRIWSPTTVPETQEDLDMIIVQAPSRGLALLAGDKLIGIGDQSTIDGLAAAGVPVAVVTDADFDRLRYTDVAPLLITEPSRGYALLSGATATGIGDLSTVQNIQGSGVATVSVTAADFDRLAHSGAGGLFSGGPRVAIPVALFAALVALAAIAVAILGR